MELSKCLGCMEDFRGYPCPKCGYDPEKTKNAEYALTPGTILAGKYLVGKVLGQGGFGITYIGWDIPLERKVAVKEYYPSGQVSRSPGTRNLTWYTTEAAEQARRDGMQMFLKEARKMSRADGIPGVVRVLDLFQENGTAYIVMEFIEGVTLKAKLQQTGPLPWEQVRELFLSVIQTMAQVHKAGLVHRDLSPDNIMLLPNGGVKILDLGAAKDLSINSGASSMQVAKSGFSPLEQYTQRGGSGPWTDVYSMAATIYYTLTGKLPPNAIDRLDKDTLSWENAALLALPPQALKALQKAMAVQAQNRTQSMDVLGQGLMGKKQSPQPQTVPGGQNSGKKPDNSAAEVNQTGEKAKKKPNKLVWIAAAAVVAAVVGTLFGIGIVGKLIKPSNNCKSTETLLDAGQTGESETLLDAGQIGASEARRIVSLSGNFNQTVALRSDGTVVATGDNSCGQCEVGDWQNITAVAAGFCYTVGLQRDGTVITAGYNRICQRNVSSWQDQDIVAIAAGDTHIVGLRRDGTVIATGNNEKGQCGVNNWNHIMDITTGYKHTVGLRVDGTVVATGDNSYGQCNVGDWRNIVAIAAGYRHTVGLCKDGTVVTAGDNAYGQDEVDDWKNIVSIAAGNWHTVGLCSDGTVVAVGNDEYGQCDLSDWQNVVAIAAGNWHTIGLRSEGTVVAVGRNDEGQCNVSSWK